MKLMKENKENPKKNYCKTCGAADHRAEHHAKAMDAWSAKQMESKLLKLQGQNASKAKGKGLTPPGTSQRELEKPKGKGRGGSKGSSGAKGAGSASGTVPPPPPPLCRNCGEGRDSPKHEGRKFCVGCFVCKRGWNAHPDGWCVPKDKGKGRDKGNSKGNGKGPGKKKNHKGSGSRDSYIPRGKEEDKESAYVIADTDSLRQVVDTDHAELDIHTCSFQQS